MPARRAAPTPAWGALVVSFFVGAALIAALVDIPIFARTTVYRDSQLMAALVLVRFLVALPVGAVVGGFLIRRLPRRRGRPRVGHGAGGGRLRCWMSTWGLDAASSTRSPTVPLVLGGLGFGLALAPVNAALLASTDDAVHGVASALVVVARMVGMLVGISALTTIGLRRYYAVQADLPSVREVCERRTAVRGVHPTCSRTPASRRSRPSSSVRRSARWSPPCSPLVLFRSARHPGVSTGDLLRSRRLTVG